MRIRKALFILGWTGLALGAVLPARPASAPGEAPLVIRGGTIFTVTGGVIENGIILIEDGKIRAIGKDVPVPGNARIIDAASSCVFPGFIDAGTNLGTVELETVERDDDEASAPLTPQLRIVDAFNPESTHIRRARSLGTTSALIAPARGNILSGQSALLRLDGGDVMEMIVSSPAAVHGTLGDAYKARFKQNRAYPYTRMGGTALLRQTLSDARDGLDRIRAREKNPKDPAPAVEPMLRALFPVLRGERPLVLAANRYDDILTALRIAEEFGLRLIIDGGAEAYRLGDRLAGMHVPVLLDPDDAFGLTVETLGAVRENASLLQKAGVKIAFRTGSVRNLGDLIPRARAAITAGLAPEEALKALTINPAEIFGVSADLGSLEAGKDADIVIFPANPLLENVGAETVIIGGKVMDIHEKGKETL
jgi:imidazolonepropionase-like amidohydrolase